MLSITTPVAILVGSIVISLSMLVSSGVINFNRTATPTPAPQAQQPAKKTEADYIKKLTEYAAKVGLDSNKFNSCLTSGEQSAKVSADLSDGNSLGVQGTPSFFINGRPLFIGASPFAEFKKVIDEELNGTAPASTERKTVAVGDLPALGNLNAPVTFVEFSDFECPFCAKFYSDAEKQIVKEYINSGKVKLYYRDYPLTPIHPGAQKSAEAGRCANSQGKFWEYHNIVFENQRDIF